MSAPRTITEAAKPTNVINLIVGIGSFNVHRKRLNKWIEYIYVINYILLVYYLTTTLLDNLKIDTLLNTENMKMLQIATYIYNLCFTTILLLAGRTKEKEMHKVMSLIEACNERMERLGLPKEYSMFYVYQIYFYGFSSFVILLMFVIFYNLQFYPDVETSKRLFFTFVLNVPLIISTITDVSFCSWIWYTCLKFHQLNKLLRGMLTRTPDSLKNQKLSAMKYDFEKKKFNAFVNENVRGSNGNLHTMRSAKYIHLELIKISRKINEAYGIQILLTMTISLIYITFLFYRAYKIIWLDDVLFDYTKEVIITLVWIFYFGAKIFSVNHVCVKTSLEVAETGSIICALYGPSTATEYRAEIRDFTLQMIQNPLIFTALGFFDIDHTFIQGVLGSITTYLVILIQVGNIPHPSNTNSTLNATIPDEILIS